MKRQLLFAVLCAIMIGGLFVVSAPYGVIAQSSGHDIARVQSIDGGAANYGQYRHDNQTNQDTFVPASNQTTATLPNTPREGDVLIASVGVHAQVSNAPACSVNVSSITQQGVVWTRQIRNSYWGWLDSVEIWLGVVGANADPTITFNVAVNLTQGADYYVIAYGVCEYSGITTNSPLDQTAVDHDTGAFSSTGTTSLTSKPNELWVGAVLEETSANQTRPLNGFSQVGGTIKGTDGRITTALLDRVVDKRGQAVSGTAITAEYTYVGYLGCIATFIGSDQTSSDPDATIAPNPSGGAYVGAMLQFSCQSTTGATIKVNIQGTLAGNDVGIANAPINFCYSINGGVSWVDFASVMTDYQGRFMVMWNPSATGNYQIKASWAGNSLQPAMSTIVNFAITPAEQQSLFSINSNSTISALSFNSENKQLSFTVSGEPGTKGYVEIYIPKTLMSDASGLEVKLDEAKLNYTLQDDQNGAWLIAFAYHHSTHQVTMNLNAETGGGGFNSGVVGWVLIVAIIIPLAAAITYTTTKRTKTEAKQASNN
jgi:hypothetical protein